MADARHVSDAENVVGSHPSVSELAIEESDDGGFKLCFEMAVQNARDGRKNDIRDKEPVELDFPPSWPFKAPKIRLRENFCRNIPHINPSHELNPGWVEPCVVDAPLDAFVRTEGLSGLLNQLQIWLDSAAYDDLRIRDDAWEPMRRDGLPIFAVADTSMIRAKVANKMGHIYLFSTIHALSTKMAISQFFIVYEDGSTGRPSAALRRIENSEINCIVLLAWADEKSRVPSIYPDGSCQLSDLLEAADLYECKTVKKGLDELAHKAGRKKEGRELLLLIVFAVRRPEALAGQIDGQRSNIELIPYIASLRPKELRTGRTLIFRADRDAHVYPVTLREISSPKLLQKISGKRFPDDRRIAIFGCGSLGSKISMHLGKSGFGRQHLVDKSVILPHNLARMGVMVDHHFPQIGKAHAVEAELSMLGHSPSISTDDIVEAASESGQISLPEDTSLVLDTTASLNVHDALCYFPIVPHNARISQTAYFAEGHVALLAFEGKGRGVDSEHIRSVFWRHWMLAGGWPGGGLSRVPLGEGCGSFTMIMSDMQASLFSAGIAQKVVDFVSQPAPDYGSMFIGKLDSDNVGVSWSGLEIPNIVQAETDGSWRVDILPDVAAEIDEAVQGAGQKETGGYLLGRMNWALRRVTITAQLPAPPDSKCTSTSFILGVEGVGIALHDMYTRAQRAFLACGTWHSHPGGGPPSPTDMTTLNELAHEAIGQPMVSLIWRSEGYLALVQRAFEEKVIS